MKKENDILEKTLDIGRADMIMHIYFYWMPIKRLLKTMDRKHCISCPVWQVGQVCLKKH